MAQFTIIINDFTGIGICKGVVIEVEDNYFPVFAKFVKEKMGDRDNLKQLYADRGVYSIAKDMLHDVFMVDLGKLEAGEDYHRNAQAKKMLTAKAKELNAVSEFTAAQYDTNHMLIDLTPAQETGDFSDIVVVTSDKDAATV